MGFGCLICFFVDHQARPSIASWTPFKDSIPPFFAMSLAAWLRFRTEHIIKDIINVLL
jgi:hypothetical protein